METKLLKWKWSVLIQKNSVLHTNCPILEGFDYNVVPDTSHKVQGAADFPIKKGVERLEICLPCGNGKEVIEYLRNLGLVVGDYAMKLESPLLDGFGGLKPEYKILKENNIQEFENLLLTGRY